MGVVPRFLVCSIHPSLRYLLTVGRDRDDPIGYKLSVIAFDGNGSPTEPSNSNTSTIDVVSNPDLSQCPDSCFRPVGLAWDSQGRLFMSSDATGEIYVVVRDDGGSANDANPTSGLPPSQTDAAPSQSSTGAAVAVGGEMLLGWKSVGEFAVAWAGIMALPLV